MSSPIKIGILHSLSGTLAFNEKDIIDGALLAVKEINESGGLLGRLIEPIILDGKSDGETFIHQAEKLITQEKVSVIFGCWMPAIYSMVKPVIEKHNHLLFYPGQYENSQTSANIVYTGLTSNQQIIPGITWCLDNLGTNFFLISSDNSFSHDVNKLITDMVTASNGTIVGQEYIPLGSTDIDPIIEKIIKTKPDVIINNIVGDSNLSFFKALTNNKITSQKIPVLSFCIEEPQIAMIGVNNIINNYSASGYFQTVSWASWTVNQSFVAHFKKQFGPVRTIGNAIETAYLSIYLWANSVIQANTPDPEKVRNHLALQSFYAPEGMIYIDQHKNHTWRFSRIGKVQKDGQFFIIWESEKAIEPHVIHE